MAKRDFNKVALQNGQTHATRFLTHAYAARFLTCAWPLCKATLLKSHFGCSPVDLLHTFLKVS